MMGGSKVFRNSINVGDDYLAINFVMHDKRKVLGTAGLGK